MEDDRLKRAGLYRTIWRWHFYAGLFVAPVLVILAVSGGLYLYKNELESAWYGALVAGTGGPAAPLSRQAAAVAEAFPGSQLRQVSLPPAEGRASEWKIATQGDENLTVFVDPATAAVNGAIASETRLMTVVANIHGGDIIAPVGGYVVELAACWTLVLIATGLYLWWPRGRRGGVFAPRLKARGRQMLRDLHAVPAVWNAAIVAFLVLSGLPWSTFWGVQLSKLGTLSEITAPSPNFEMHQPDHQQHMQDAGRDIPWSIRHAPAAGEGHEHHADHHAGHPPGLDELMALAAANGIDRPGLRIFLPKPGQGGTIMLSHVPDAAQDQRTIDLDPATGAVRRNAGWDAYSPLAKVVEFGTMTHMGRQFGEPNRLLMLASCIVLLMTVIMGVLMWWRRRPALSPATTAERRRPGAPVIAIAVTLGVLFPLLGASLVAIALIELLLGALKARDRQAAA